MRTLVAMATYSINGLLMGKMEIGNFYCLIGDNRISFLQFSTVIRLLLDSLNLIGCRGNIKSEFSEEILFLKNK